MGDFYLTPKSLVWELLYTGEISKRANILEPSSGQTHQPIVETIKEYSRGVHIDDFDLYAQDERKQDDFLQMIPKKAYDIIITNPPFSMWDAFVFKAKALRPEKIIMLGRTNCLGAHSRNISGLWKELKTVYVFDRMIDYRTPYRKDGLFHVGAMVTGWFIWEKGWQGPPNLSIMNVQKYAKLGAYKEDANV